MQFALFPFRSLKDAGGADIRSKLKRDGSVNPGNGGPSNLELLDFLVDRLREQPWEMTVDYCHEKGGDLRLAVVADDLGRNLDVGDRVQAGLFVENSESGAFAPFAGTRVYRVACQNGYLMECEQTQSASLAGAGWRERLVDVVDRSLAGEGLDRDTARFRSTMSQMMVTPYELLCNLTAQGYVTDDEASDIQREFDEVGDFTMYGFVNAVTRIAAECRDSDDWKRSVELERLGGEVLRGDHQPPVLDAIYQW